MILAIESSTPHAGLALFDLDKKSIVWSAEFVSDRSHNSKIFQPLREALGFCERELTLIAVGVGPGSYSGVRVGIAVANGISLARGIPVTGFSSLEAYSDAPDFLVVGDAKRNSIFTASVENGMLRGEPELMEKNEFSERIAAKEGKKKILTMDEKIAENHEGIELVFPDAGRIASTAARLLSGGETIENRPVEPHYLRPPYITTAKKKPVPGFPK